MVGIPHNIKGQAIYAYVTLNHGEEPTPELYAEVRNWVRKEIGPLATPDVLHWTDSLPKTRSGKIMRRILRKIAAGDTSNLGDTSTLADPLHPLPFRGEDKNKSLPQDFTRRNAVSNTCPGSVAGGVAVASVRRVDDERETSGDAKMNEQLCQRIENSAHFRELVASRQRFAAILSVIMLVIYVGFILLIAFAPGWLGTPLHAGTSVTRGIPLGIGVIVISFILTGIYVWRANGEFDRLTKSVLNEVKA